MWVTSILSIQAASTDYARIVDIHAGPVHTRPALPLFRESCYTRAPLWLFGKQSAESSAGQKEGRTYKGAKVSQGWCVGGGVEAKDEGGALNTGNAWDSPLSRVQGAW